MHKLKHLFLLVCCSLSFAAFAQKHNFALGDSAFLLDGKPLQIISGELHYPRIPKEAWRHRMKMAKAMGLNTIGTYIFWNLHEPEKGVFDFKGSNDILQFVKIAQEEGLWVILRPSPYVCAEWEFGGYPYWLQNEKGLQVRSMEKQYIDEYRKYINQIGKQLAPYQVNRGGNILMVQIENEYGSYGSDKEYLELNRKMFVDAGFDGLLYTCDPAADLVKGHLPGLLPAVNGLDKPTQIRRLINNNHAGKGPYFIAEWYPAWFDWWGTPHHTVPAEKYTPALDSVLKAGMSINMYMFHGGTTRDFMNGANYKGNTPYEPQISSYDYDAPLDEAGNATPKFMAFRDVIKKHLPAGNTLAEVPAAKPVIAIDNITLAETAGLFSMLPVAKTAEKPMTFEDANQAYGYMLYRTTLNNAKSGLLKLKDLRDYAVVFVNGKRAGMLDRRLAQDSLQIEIPSGEVALDILVENMGRINFGPYLLQNKKGITEAVFLGGQELKNWKMYSLPFKTAPSIKAGGRIVADQPVIKRGSFNLSSTGDTYLDMRSFGKGVVWVNGHNLGKYWSIGPQQTLYLPVEWLRKGSNEIVVFEMLKSDASEIKGLEKPILNEVRK
jgi:beta-galactosidase